MAKGMTVSLASKSAFGLGGSAGQSQVVNMLDPNKASTEAYADILNKLDTQFGKIPGGTLKFAHASNRSVTMNQTFNHPLAVGYLGFDFPILEHGWLGTPVATHRHLSTGIKQPSVLIKKLKEGDEWAFTQLVVLYETLKEAADENGRANAIIEQLNTDAPAIPDKYELMMYEEIQQDKIRGVLPWTKDVGTFESPLRKTIAYVSKFQEASKDITEWLKNNSLTIDGRSVDDLRADQEKLEQRVSEVLRMLNKNGAINQAVTYYKTML
jgi:hypothetical protein